MSRGWCYLPLPLHMKLQSRNDRSKVKQIGLLASPFAAGRNRIRQIRSEVVESGFSMLPQHH
eukprot:6930822-Prymnesium_polylepis.1